MKTKFLKAAFLALALCVCHPDRARPAQLEVDEENFILSVSGTWEEIGEQLGSYKAFTKPLQRGRRFWDERLEAYFAGIEKLIPADVIAQMRGMAKGISASGEMGFDDAYKSVVAWNLFIDLYNMPKGCSAFAAAAKDGKQYLLHNTDGSKEMAGGWLMIFKPDNGHAFVSYYGPQFAGVTMGANEKGLAIVYNVAKQKDPQLGLPVLLMNRMILAQCASYDEVVKKLNDFIGAGNKFGPAAANMVLVDFNQRRMARIEMASDRVEIQEATMTRPGGPEWISATNHYVKMKEKNRLLPETSVNRLDRLNHLLSSAPEFSLPALLGFLADHAGQDSGSGHTVCVHTDKNNPDVMTVSTQGFDSDFNVYWSVGNPCASFVRGGLKVVNWLKIARGEKEKPRAVNP